MSLTSAAILEPIDNDGHVSIVAVHDRGTHDVLDSADLMYNETHAKEERDFFKNLVKTTAWPLPKNFIDKEYWLKENEDLSRIHSKIVIYLQNYLWFSNDDMYDLVANWVISTYLRPWFEFAPLLIFDGVTRSGKSTALKVLRHIVYRGVLNTNYSAASIARQIEALDCSMLLDESQDNIESDRGLEIVSLLKSGFDRDGAKWIRADPKSSQLHVYNVFTSTAIAIKGVNLPEDVYNRGIRIGMVGMPEGLELYDINSVLEDDVEGEHCPVEIRTELYAMRMMFMCPNADGLTPVDWKELRVKVKRHFAQKTENGQWFYAFVHGMKKAPRIHGRMRNIASVLYTIGMSTLTDKETLQQIIENEDATREEIIDTPEAIAFFALLDIFFRKWKDMGDLYRSKDGTVDSKTFDDIVSGISTVDIMQQFNVILNEQGNAGRDPVPTKTITAKIKALGLEYTSGAQNRSYLRPERPLFKPSFLQHVKQYAPEYIDTFVFGEDGEVKTLYKR